MYQLIKICVVSPYIEHNLLFYLPTDLSQPRVCLGTWISRYSFFISVCLTPISFVAVSYVS